MGSSLRTAARSLASTPLLTLPALACIVAGMASALLIATLADAVLFRAPALPEPERLARVWLHRGTQRIEQGGLSYLEYRDLLAVRAFDRVEAAARTRLAIRTAAGSERLRGEAVSRGYFDLLGVRPALGRPIGDAEQGAAGAPVMLIGHDLWQRRFAGDPSVVGQRLVVRGRRPADPETAYTIIGVMPPRFVGSVDADVSEFWVPLERSPLRGMFADREARNIWVLARRAAGTSLARAQAEVAAFGGRLRAADPALYAGSSLVAEPFGESWRAPLRAGLFALLGAAALLLLIACANVAHLLTARVVKREGELALRLSLGASRGHLLRALGVETLLLAGIGGALGTLLAQRAVTLLAGEAALDLPSYVPVGVDARVTALALLLVLGTAALFGVLPALLAGRVEAAHRLREGARGLTLAARQRRLNDALVVSQLAVTLVLVVAGGLLLRSYLTLLRTDVGFRTDHLLRMAITLDAGEHPDEASVLAFAERAREVVRRQPGVRAVALMSEVLPPWFDDTFAVVHRGQRDPQLTEVARHAVDRELLGVLDVALVAGRPFGPEDRAGGRAVALVSASLARRLAGAGGATPTVASALGRTLQLVADPATGELSPPLEVVGVVEDVRYHGPLGSARPPHDLYVPFEQAPSHVVSFAIHTSVPPGPLAPPLQRAIGRLAPTSPMHWISTMEEELSGQLAGARFYGRLTALYAATAALLALLGVYGVMAHAVCRRRGELAVRAAVGARRADLLRLVVGEGLRTLLAGLLLGSVAALLATRALRGLLHGVAATDPLTYLAAAALLLFLGVLACWLPARRAAATDPAAVLRAP